MKKLITSASVATKPNKTKLRQQFIKLATDIRDLSKYEFVTLLKEDTTLAMQWIDELQRLYTKFEEEAKNSLQYYVMRILVDGNFVGYLSSIEYNSYRMGGGSREIYVTQDIEEARQFANPKEADVAFRSWYNNVVVYTGDGVGYEYDYKKCKDPNIIGKVNKDKLDYSDEKLYYVKKVSFEVEEI